MPGSVIRVVLLSELNFSLIFREFKNNFNRQYTGLYKIIKLCFCILKRKKLKVNFEPIMHFLTELSFSLSCRICTNCRLNPEMNKKKLLSQLWAVIAESVFRMSYEFSNVFIHLFIFLSH